MVLDDKYALYDVLREKKLPVAEYQIVYGEKVKEDYAEGCNTFSYVEDYFYKHNCDIVLKPNDGTCGRDVYRVQDVEQLRELYDQMTRKYYSINMGPFYQIQNEYRFVVFDGKVRIAYQKNKPVVLGDGVHSIRELLIEFNPNYFQERLNDSIYDRVLEMGEEFEYNWKFNLSQGAIASEIQDSLLYQKLEEIAISSSNTVGLRFGSVDIIVTKERECFILEMNSGVMLENYMEQFSDGFETAKELYKDVIIKMFQ